GFALEEFDATGRFRDTERDKPVNAMGEYRGRSGENVTFTGATELASFLMRSPETHRSVVRQLFHHQVQQPILAFGPDTIQEMTAFFTNHNYNLKQLMVEIACRSAEHHFTKSTSEATGD
ncbi:MAG: DUF1585 domain-containing protein, partial [Planctomycetaceae bacterium]|nr:DUF1585 domain-containing protein [Planctomycetaceae bacterium]